MKRCHDEDMSVDWLGFVNVLFVLPGETGVEVDEGDTSDLRGYYPPPI